MKRLIFLLLLFPSILFAQQGLNSYGPLKIQYGGNTALTGFSDDSLNYVNSKSFNAFNKKIKAPLFLQYPTDTLATKAYARSVGGGSGLDSSDLVTKYDLASGLYQNVVLASPDGNNGITIFNGLTEIAGMRTHIDVHNDSIVLFAAKVIGVKPGIAVDTSGIEIRGFVSKPWGADVASANTITPSGPLFKVTGTTQIETINLPYTGFSGEIKIVFVSGCVLGTSGNIAVGSVTIIPGKLYIAAYNPFDYKWYLSN